MYTHDLTVPVKRLQVGRASGALVDAPLKKIFLRGPIPMQWLSEAARLPGKTISVALALWWLYGMSKRKPFKLRGDALNLMHVSRDATDDGLARLEQRGLIQVERKTGQRPTISIIEQCSVMSRGQEVGASKAACSKRETIDG
jgi:hypothetical protein